MSSPLARKASQERWLQFFNRVVYARLPAVYNALDWLTLGAWWRLVRRALDYAPQGGRVLEVGFGPGRLHLELAKQSDECHGLDLAFGMCRFTRRRLQSAGLQHRIVRGNAFSLPYPAKAFDQVVSTFALSGLIDGAKAVQEIGRVLAPGGQLILIDIGLPADGNRLGRALARTWERMGDVLYEQPDLMQAAGLDLTVCREFGPGKHIRAVVGAKPGN